MLGAILWIKVLCREKIIMDVLSYIYWLVTILILMLATFLISLFRGGFENSFEFLRIHFVFRRFLRNRPGEPLPKNGQNDC